VDSFPIPLSNYNSRLVPLTRADGMTTTPITRETTVTTRETTTTTARETTTITIRDNNNDR
jgi:hypothetical protein